MDHIYEINITTVWYAQWVLKLKSADPLYWQYIHSHRFHRQNRILNFQKINEKVI